MKTVLIADDEPVMRMDLSDMLNELGFQVIGEATDGFDAVELCRQKHPDLALLDVRMPVFDGLSAAETIIKEKLSDCVMLITAFSDMELIERAAKIGVAGYLVKPIMPNALLPAIEVAVAQEKRNRMLQGQLDGAEQKLRDERTIRKAQIILMETQRCSELEAYRQMRTMAMNKRTTVAAIARRILHQMEQADEVAQTKELLMQREKMSESAAYQYIRQKAEVWKCTNREAAKRIQTALEGRNAKP